MKTNQPCPFCGSLDLRINTCFVNNDEEDSEVICNHCYGIAPLHIWNGERWNGKSKPKPAEDQIEFFSKENNYA